MNEDLIAQMIWNYETVTEYLNNANGLLEESSTPPLTIALNTKIGNDDHRIRETILNGWPNNFVSLNKCIREHWRVGNEACIQNASSFHSLISKNMSSSFVPNYYYQGFLKKDVKDSYKHIKLSDIPRGSKYMYPVNLLGSGMLWTESAQTVGLYLPDRVVSDAKEGICKILLQQIFEGHNFNTTYVRSMFERIVETYNIPMRQLGFLDGNYLTPSLQAGYGSKGFYYPFWEFHVVDPHFNDRWKKHEELVLDRLEKMHEGELNLPYRFINLNRRIRTHRTIITSHIHDNHPEKFLWSYTEATKNKLDGNPGLSSSYLDNLPKIIDADETVNDTLFNNMQHQAYINLVNETWFERGSLFFSEKIFKPIYGGQPFIVVGAAGSLALLRKMGYETFHPYIDETYDTILNPSERMSAILKEVDRICSLDHDGIRVLMNQLSYACARNYKNITHRIGNSIPLQDVVQQIKEWVENE